MYGATSRRGGEPNIADKRPQLTHRLTEPQVLDDTRRLARLILRNEQPEAVQYEQYLEGRKWVLHLSNKHRVEVYIPHDE